MQEIIKTLAVFTPGIFLLFFSYGNYWSSHWYSKWSLLVAFFSVLYAFVVSKKTSFLFFPIILTSLLSACWVAFFIDNQYKSTADLLMIASLQNGAMYSYLAIVMATSLMAFLPKSFASSVEKYMASICVLSSIYMVYQIKNIAYERGAFSGNAGMSACLVACLLPFLIKPNSKLNYPAIIISGTACILSHSSVGIGTFVVVLTCYFLRSFSVSLKNMSLIGFSAAIPLLAALKYIPVEWLSSSGRVGVWRSLFHWWSINSSARFGAGLGTGISLFPMIQRMYGTTGAGFYLWMHSEWLQILFELGKTGLLFTLIAFGYLAVRAWRSPKLFSSLIGFGTCSIADYPLRLPIHCTSAVLLAWLILQNKRVEI